LHKNTQINNRDNNQIDAVEGRTSNDNTEQSVITNVMSFAATYTERAKNNE